MPKQMNKDQLRWGKEVKLPPDAKPEEHTVLRFKETGAYRSLGCALSSLCLAYACSQHWDAFTCIYCPWHTKGGKRVEESRSLEHKDYDFTENLILSKAKKKETE